MPLPETSGGCVGAAVGGGAVFLCVKGMYMYVWICMWTGEDIRVLNLRQGYPR